MTPVGPGGRYYPDPKPAGYASLARQTVIASGESDEFDTESTEEFFAELILSAIGKNEVQKITLTKPVGGKFKLIFEYEDEDEEVVEEETAPIKYNATAAEVKAALEKLTGIGAGNISVAGEAGGPWTVTFVGDLAATNVAALKVDDSELTGEEAESKVETTTAGAGASTFDLKLETKVGDDWSEVGKFTQKTAPDVSDNKVLGPLGTSCRWKWTLGAGGGAVFKLRVEQPA